ncbi:hypothetical protein [Chitinophaga niabensis]|uniref:Lipocalin-like domain-containing protein n=1 Tax=Chitinophaga niabensis TaxID=536979 RepID=A0A1N6J947_9BACT|nr:hypothetical protein [Chitinophaga niabensis]SIO40701.1 hypothetical protein SAMN04488055_3752 [Chitinophaga niabensis]
MKRNLLIVLIAFAACKKDNATYDGSLNGRWELNALSEPYAIDRAWKPVPAADSSILILRSNATYSFTRGNYYASTGTFTVTDSTANIKILRLTGDSLFIDRGRLFIERLSAKEFKMDYNPGWCGTGYTSRKYEKKD